MRMIGPAFALLFAAFPLAAQTPGPAPSLAEQAESTSDVIRVGVRVAPPFVIESEGRYSGLAISLWEQVAAERGYTFPITLDWRPLAAALSRRNIIPLTVTVDRTGRLRHVIPGEMFEQDVSELAALGG